VCKIKLPFAAAAENKIQRPRRPRSAAAAGVSGLQKHRETFIHLYCSGADPFIDYWRVN